MKTFIFNLLCCLASAVPMALAMEPAPSPPADRQAEYGIVVDMPFGLFCALSEYEDLKNAEDLGDQTSNARMIPVLHKILGELKKYQDGVARSNQSIELRGHLDKISGLIRDFAQELRFRETVEEYHLLLEKQKNIIQR